MAISAPVPVTIATCSDPGPLGGLLRAVGCRYNMTSKLAIKPGGAVDGPDGTWVLVVAEAPFATSEVAAYVRGWLDAIPGRAPLITVPE